MRVKDNGGVQSGGVDMSAVQTFTISVSPSLFPWHNDTLRSDIVEDGKIDISDILVLVYYFNNIPYGNLPFPNTTGLPFRRVDVVANNRIDIGDILAVVYDFNQATQPEGEDKDIDFVGPTHTTTVEVSVADPNEILVELLAADMLTANRNRRRLLVS